MRSRPPPRCPPRLQRLHGGPCCSCPEAPWEPLSRTRAAVRQTAIEPSIRAAAIVYVFTQMMTDHRCLTRSSLRITGRENIRHMEVRGQGRWDAPQTRRHLEADVSVPTLVGSPSPAPPGPADGGRLHPGGRQETAERRTEGGRAQLQRRGRVGMLSAGVKKVRREILTHFLFLLLGRQTSAPSSEEFPPRHPSPQLPSS